MHYRGAESDVCRADCMLQLTLLRKLKLYRDEYLLPGLTSPNLLSTLADVWVTSAQDLPFLIALKQIAALVGVMGSQHWVICLQAVTGLRKIAAGFACGPGGISPDLERPVHRLPEIGGHL